MALTEQQIDVLLGVFTAIKDAVKDCGETGMPEGILYAAMMEKLPGCSIEAYHRIIDAAVRQNVFRRSNHVLYYIEHTK